MFIHRLSRACGRLQLVSRGCGAHALRGRRSGSSSTRPPVRVSEAERAAWDERQERMLWWNDLYKSGGDVFTLEGASPTLIKWWPHVSALAREAAAAVAAEAAAAAAAASATAGTRAAAPPGNELPLARVLVPGVGRDASAAWLARQAGWGAVGVDFADAPLRALGNDLGGLEPIHEGTSASGEGAGRGCTGARSAGARSAGARPRARARGAAWRMGARIRLGSAAPRARGRVSQRGSPTASGEAARRAARRRGERRGGAARRRGEARLRRF